MFPIVDEIIIPMKYISSYDSIYKSRETMSLIKGFREYNEFTLSPSHLSKLEKQYYILYEFVIQCNHIIEKDKGMDELYAIHQKTYPLLDHIATTFMKSDYEINP